MNINENKTKPDKKPSSSTMFLDMEIDASDFQTEWRDSIHDDWHNADLIEFNQSFEDGASFRLFLDRVVGYKMSSRVWKAFCKWVEDSEQRTKNIRGFFVQIDIQKLDGELSCDFAFNKKKMKAEDVERVVKYAALLKRAMEKPLRF